ncbi:MAG TPA: hypothetical protein VFB55_13675, partial [Verrucomicrobiae bacterium]|nr:hypothetical protein [Verrucomicrobiae bacterium]
GVQIADDAVIFNQLRGHGRKPGTRHRHFQRTKISGAALPHRAEFPIAAGSVEGYCEPARPYRTRKNSANGRSIYNSRACRRRLKTNGF